MLLQRKIFFVIFGIAYFLEAIGGFYMATSVVSIEKQLQISSKISGFLVAVSDLSYILAVPIVSYYGGKGDRVRWIGFGCLLVAVGDIIIGSSNLIFSPRPNIDNFSKIKQDLESTVNTKNSLQSVRSFLEYLSSVGIENPPTQIMELLAPTTYNSSVLNYNDNIVSECNAGNLSSEFCTSYSRFINPKGMLSNEETLQMRALSGLPYAICNTIINQLRQQIKNYQNMRHPSNLGPILQIIIGLLALGVGRTVPFSLGLPLIDDKVQKQNLPLCYGMMFIARVLGPILGLIAGSQANRFYYRFEVPEGLTPHDPLWIGRWWIGFIIMGVLLLIPSVLLAAFTCISKMFEKKSSKDTNRLTDAANNSEEIPLKEEYANDAKETQPMRQFNASVPKQANSSFSPSNNIKEYWREVKKVFKSKIYLGALIGRTIDTFVFRGFFLFLPKYLEIQFGKPQHEVNMYMGVTGMLGFALGSFIGSFVLQKLRFRGKQAALWILIFSAISAIVPFVNSFVGCNSVISSLVNTTSENPLMFNNTCNNQCDCAGVPLYPVCNSIGRTFYSPCHAGCIRYNSVEGSSFEKTFKNCQCANTDDGAVSRGYCKEGVCSTKFIIYMALMGFSGLTGGLTVVPAMVLVLRSVEHENRSIALGVQGLIITLFGTLISPVAWGWIIDADCVLWNYPYGTEERGSCALYYSDNLRKRLHLVNGAFRVVSLLADVYVLRNASNSLLLVEQSVTKSDEKAEKNDR